MSSAAANFGANIAFIIKVRVQLLRDTGRGDEPVQLVALPCRARNAAAAHGAAQPERHGGRPLPDRASEGLLGQLSGSASHPAYKTGSKYHQRGLFGAILGFGVRGGLEAGKTVIENVKLFSHLANIGDAKSLIIHPATTTHSQLTEEEQATTGVTPDYVRLSVGLETVSDIIADLDQALSAI